jgi:hypothetical protein
VNNPKKKIDGKQTPGMYFIKYLAGLARDTITVCTTCILVILEGKEI